MSSLRPVGRSAATLNKDRKSLCRFTFADGRQCRTPRSPHHSHFCSDHARKDSQACAADKLALELSYLFSGEYLSACDLSAALGADSWSRTVRNSVHQNFDHRHASPPPEPSPDQALQPTPQPAPSPHTPMPPTRNEFTQHVVAGRNLSLLPRPCRGSGRETGEKSSLT